MFVHILNIHESTDSMLTAGTFGKIIFLIEEIRITLEPLFYSLSVGVSVWFLIAFSWKVWYGGKHIEMEFGIQRLCFLWKTPKFSVPKCSVLQNVFSSQKNGCISEKSEIIKGRITSSIFQGSCDIRIRKGSIIWAGNKVSKIPYGVRSILLVVSCIWALFICDLGHIACHFRILFLKYFRQFQNIYFML